MFYIYAFFFLRPPIIFILLNPPASVELTIGSLVFSLPILEIRAVIPAAITASVNLPCSLLLVTNAFPFLYRFFAPFTSLCFGVGIDPELSKSLLATCFSVQKSVIPALSFRAFNFDAFLISLLVTFFVTGLFLFWYSAKICAFQSYTGTYLYSSY